jgi:glycosyltransferase involved in cell wall biosynthesis
MLSEPLVSIVTPVYNTGEYLEDAIRSVLAQTYANWEYIICNNHSTDTTADVAAKYAAIDPRIRVVTPPEFLPQARNFNYALQQISPDSRYCKMIMADDKLFPRCLEEMVAVGEAQPSVAIVSAYRLVDTWGECFGLPLAQTVIPGRVAGRLHLLNGVFLFGTPSTVMYRSSVVRDRSPEFFPEDRFYFDTDAAMRILVDKDFGFVHQVLTYSRYQPGSITRRERNYCSRQIDYLICLDSYGRIYLTPEEFQRCSSHARRVYYECLGKEWLLERIRGRTRDFWEYHEKRLAGIGQNIRTSLVAWGAGYAILRGAGSPLEVIREIARRRRAVENPWQN